MIKIFVIFYISIICSSAMSETVANGTGNGIDSDSSPMRSTENPTCVGFTNEDITKIVQSYCDAITVHNKIAVSRNYEPCIRIGSKNGHSFALLKTCSEHTKNTISYKYCLANIDNHPNDFTEAKIKACTTVSKFPAQLSICMTSTDSSTTVEKIIDCAPSIFEKEAFRKCLTK